MGGTDDFRDPIEVDAETFISVKGCKAIGKRITTLHIAKVEELEPLRFPEIDENPVTGEGGNEEPEEPESDRTEPDTDEPEPSEAKTQDETNGQLSFDF